PIVDLLARFAAEKGATSAQISLAWMLAKWPHVVPIPGSKRKERILENLGAADVSLTGAELDRLEAALDAVEVHGHRGFDESEGRSFLRGSR
ncbi:MAG: aldo/keto reductase, partial [Actinomyces succiniciruminis]|nr:aldo/keto reductase [Actinomyces succiniciruminis]